mmetsp:Transcript_38847/g.91422  ORF Transcript_38847/g.91422 Transcript_38847/m.91422 type:complete len:97 (+) Transcript_38847:1383-1673(+)
MICMAAFAITSQSVDRAASPSSRTSKGNNKCDSILAASAAQEATSKVELIPPTRSAARIEKPPAESIYKPCSPILQLLLVQEQHALYFMTSIGVTC